jgi:copper(I)-binding protein
MIWDKFPALAVLCVCILISACGGEPKPPLVATDVVIIEPMPGKKMTAGYLSLTNHTDAAISITGVSSPEFESVEIHESLLDEGVAKMRRIPELSIPANTTVVLERGGKHLMLMRPTGTPTQVTLSFQNGDTTLLSVRAPVTPRNN